MRDKVYKYLKFIRFKDVERWDFKSLNNKTKSFKYPSITLNKILSKTNVEWIDIDDNGVYPILGVHAHGEGVYINKIAQGKELTMKRYQKSKADTLFYCKVRTVNGQWGIVYPQYANSYGSSNMQYLDIDYNKILPGYFLNLLKLKRLTDIWDKNAIGADGRHFPLNTLLKLDIPLPTIEEQQTLINAYNDKITTAIALDQKAKEVERDTEDYIFSELGIKSQGYPITESELPMASEPQVEYVVNRKQNIDTADTYIWGNEIKKEYKYLKFVRFKDIKRWDVLY